MTPKEKAEDLYWTYYQKVADGSSPEYIAKQCALICCDEVLGYMGADRGYEFWTEVKKEIEQL